MSTTTLIKHPSEHRNMEFGFVARLATGETITGTPTVTAAPSGLTIGTVTVLDGRVLQFAISGGSNGQVYRITATVATTASQTLVAQGDLVVTSQVLGWVAPAVGALNGLDGKTIVSGTEAPTTEGVDGDLYFRTTTRMIYGPKAGGVWPVGVSLIGPAGPSVTGSTGLTGPTGPPGSASAVDMVSSLIVMNLSTILADLTIPAGYNAYSAGPLTIGDGINVTVADGGNWSVL
jgi:hypothetical protein